MHQSELENFGYEAKVVLARSCGGKKNAAVKRELGSLKNPSAATPPIS